MKGQKPAMEFNAYDENAFYWTDGKNVFFREMVIKNADIDSFEHFPGSWAKDNKYCYSGATKIKAADVTTFNVLNFAYAKDKSHVWTLAGLIPQADPETFEVCDSGKKSLGITFYPSNNNKKNRFESFVPYGFAKDLNNVYYYDFQGTAKIIKQANAASFQSLDDGYFGFDEKSVFCGSRVLPKAKPETWNKLQAGYFYSQDSNRIYYFNRLIKEADAASFEIVVVPSVFETPTQYARDKNHYYFTDQICSKDDFDKWTEEETVQNQKYIEENKTQ